MSRAQDQISMPKDLPVKYSGIMEFAALPARQRQAPALVRDVRRARTLGLRFLLPSKGCRHGNANYFGKDCGKGKESARKAILLWNVSLGNQAIAIVRAVPEFSDEATNANPPRSRVLKW